MTLSPRQLDPNKMALQRHEICLVVIRCLTQLEEVKHSWISTYYVKGAQGFLLMLDLALWERMVRGPPLSWGTGRGWSGAKNLERCQGQNWTRAGDAEEEFPPLQHCSHLHHLREWEHQSQHHLISLSVSFSLGGLNKLNRHVKIVTCMEGQTYKSTCMYKMRISIHMLTKTLNGFISEPKWLTLGSVSTEHPSKVHQVSPSNPPPAWGSAVNSHILPTQNGAPTPNYIGVTSSPLISAWESQIKIILISQLWTPRLLHQTPELTPSAATISYLTRLLQDKILCENLLALGNLEVCGCHGCKQYLSFSIPTFTLMLSFVWKTMSHRTSETMNLRSLLWHAQAHPTCPWLLSPPVASSWSRPWILQFLAQPLK